jgi:aminopeptidase N
MRPFAPGFVLVLAACALSPDSPTPMRSDPHSFAEPDRVRSTHLDLSLNLDFDRKIAKGAVTHTLQRTDQQASFVVDTNGLTIHAVQDQKGEFLSFEQPNAADEHLGKPLRIQLLPGSERVTIRYSTAPDAEAMQWLAPEQTDGKKQPFLFTQGQAILTRTWIPLQDTPAVRATWTARIQAPDGLVTVMSASQRRVDGGVTLFTMDKPVPSYLIALACGDLLARDVGPRCAVWAEPGMLDLAARELGDTEAMVTACEKLFGAYRWGRYDLLVLPPSFPFGGMENPCLTFATPTILAGDKSLVSLVAHELAHSWSGNLVTNATWRDFWLNEGFTVYLESRIMESVYGRERSAMETSLGMQELAAELQELPPGDQVLHIDLSGRNPDDGVTGVPYHKGAALLRRLEQVHGRTAVDAFLAKWFDQHAFTSVTTATFVEFLRRELLAGSGDKATAVDLDVWITQPGLPGDAPVPDAALFGAVDAQLAKWREGTAPSALATNGWVTQQWLRFLAGLGQPGAVKLAELDAQFAFTRSGNSEILCAWLVLAIQNDYHAVDRRCELFLMTVGRRKFLKPLYDAMCKRPDGKAKALAIYQKARPRYHAVSQRILDAMLGFTAK